MATKAPSSTVSENAYWTLVTSVTVSRMPLPLRTTPWASVQVQR